MEHLIAIVAKFAKAKHLTEGRAFRYLQRFKGINFLNANYNIAHTLRMEDVLDDLAAYCRRQEGLLHETLPRFNS